MTSLTDEKLKIDRKWLYADRKWLSVEQKSKNGREHYGKNATQQFSNLYCFTVNTEVESFCSHLICQPIIPWYLAVLLLYIDYIIVTSPLDYPG